MKLSFSPLQLLSPVQLIFCLILFFLPWIELSCTLPPDVAKNAPPGELEKLKKDTGIDPSRPIRMYTQSGLQIATGDVSVSPDFEKGVERVRGGAGAGPGPKFGPDPSNKADGQTAPLLFLFPVALLAGIVIGFVPWPHLARRLVLVVCCLGAMGIVGAHAAIGFPLEKEIAKQKEKMKGGGAFGAAPGAKAAPGTAGEPEVFRVRWQIPLYLTLILLLGAAGTAFLDAGLTAKKKPKRRYRADEEYEDDEEEEERPRKRRPKAVDEDEDERPARKPKFEVVDEDEDEPPRKRPKPRRRDEDEDDDRPRRSRRRDDD
ncbi:hypothetical protein GobsT_32250 [Gemmata obscuriglobus]|uniref:Uncharacterized protein n=1 Tax=Gemmata obscuriglobus TaxID=114 RepID=A0A2Z3H4G0_9BACT|nr:hypothetical protein [Gemmata obscuriglobus]AWM38597.1 hypothetical protein C1280_17480 [Gemmata obscuriglobus]QEG28446.1 hypothetical protein GobsT_32250 [Gemmata obscuriglobus]VTS06430.1 unnamed protein product [Gemmata obscuriglobus UQM 2246]